MYDIIVVFADKVEQNFKNYYFPTIDNDNIIRLNSFEDICYFISVKNIFLMKIEEAK